METKGQAADATDTPPPGSAEDTGVVIDYPHEKLDKKTFEVGMGWFEGKHEIDRVEGKKPLSAENLDSGTLKALANDQSEKVRDYIQNVNVIRDNIKAHIPAGEQRDVLDRDIKQSVADLVNTERLKPSDGAGSDNETPLTNTPDGWLRVAQKIRPHIPMLEKYFGPIKPGDEFEIPPDELPEDIPNS